MYLNFTKKIMIDVKMFGKLLNYYSCEKILMHLHSTTELLLDGNMSCWTSGQVKMSFMIRVPGTPDPGAGTMTKCRSSVK